MEKLRQWQKIKEIVGSALERPAAERRAYLEERCSHDPELRAEAESLLSAYPDSVLLESPLPISVESGRQIQIIGPYRLLKELGIGGMGHVWLAEQTEPIRRQVALKLIRAGMYESEAVQRFKAERQSLAIMDHPAIAKVFDAGTTPAGQPYLVMEYVAGQPITDYCDSRKLTIRERLQLFKQVCEGVQHAHQKAIIHRDLKPSNVLVVEVDGKPMPRIIDFGLAKTIAPVLSGQTQFTQAGMFLGTPGYMSPEQANPEMRDIDTRTDVYSLGTILYELLAGCLPFDVKGSGKRRPDEVLRQLQEEDSPRPSAKVSSDRESATTTAAARSTRPNQLISLLRGDLDRITLKALERDRERRYGSPSELAADIDNHLQNRPVKARTASVLHRACKYVQRHAAGVGVATAAAVLLVVFAVMQAVQLRGTALQRDRADRIAEFMTNMFDVSDPSEARGNTITAREILDKSANEIHTSLTKDPDLRADMLHAIGSVYLKLGLYTRADSILREAVETRKRVLGPNNPKTLESSAQLAFVLENEGRYTEAEKLERELLATDRSVLGVEHRATLAMMSLLSWTLDSEGHEQEALDLARNTLQAQQRLLGNEDRDTLLSVRRLAVVLNSSGQYGDAEALFRQTSEIHRRLLGPEHPETLAAMGDLGFVLLNENRNAEAEAVLSSTLEAQRRVLGPEHENTLATMNSLANALANEHRYTEAEKLYRDAYDIASRVLGKEHRYTLGVLANIATLMHDQGHYREAESLDREILAVRLRTQGPDHPDTATAMFNVGDALRGEGRYLEAEKTFRETVALDIRVLGPNHPDTLDALYNLAAVLALEHRKDDALSTLGRAVDGRLPAEDAAKIETDAAFNSLRTNPKFLELVSRAKQVATPVLNPN